MKILWQKFISPDPATFGFAFSAWAAIVGISLAHAGNSFDLSPAWGSLKQLHTSDTEWGYAMMADSLLLFATLRLRRIPYRAAIVVFSAMMWAVLGMSMVVNGWMAGFFSIVGGYSVWCAFQGLLTVGHWYAEERYNGYR